MEIRIDEGPSKTNLTAGTNPLSLYLPTISSDIYGAKGNSGDMVINVKNTDDRRSEVSHKDEIWAQRLGKARYQH